MASGTLSAQVRIPIRNSFFFYPPPPPAFYAHTILLGGKSIRRRKNYAAAEWKSGGGKITAGVGKKSHSAEDCCTVPKIPYWIS